MLIHTVCSICLEVRRVGARGVELLPRGHRQPDELRQQPVLGQ